MVNAASASPDPNFFLFFFCICFTFVFVLCGHMWVVFLDVGYRWHLKIGYFIKRAYSFQFVSIDSTGIWLHDTETIYQLGLKPCVCISVFKDIKILAHNTSVGCLRVIHCKFCALNNRVMKTPNCKNVQIFDSFFFRQVLQLQSVIDQVRNFLTLLWGSSRSAALQADTWLFLQFASSTRTVSRSKENNPYQMRCKFLRVRKWTVSYHKVSQIFCTGPNIVFTVTEALAVVLILGGFRFFWHH